MADMDLSRFDTTRLIAVLHEIRLTMELAQTDDIRKDALR